ncbi:hypothetical protein FB451DRAFT_1240274 [Mycena latifolia]|nr:hypothetical protein FB451DRAFT_1240274 [Mycena latifolia]
MYSSGKAVHPPPQDIACFRNPCGRRGCGHIIEYVGPNPLENISRLVNEHYQVCPGRLPVAAHTLDTHWHPRPQNLDDLSLDKAKNVPEDRSLSPQSRGWSSPPAESQIGGPSESGTSSTSSRSTRNTKSLPPSVVAPEISAKKSSRSEAERRKTLETDEWTMDVTPHEVVCRGCRRSIKLDRRSRYYPGLWEKHRDRCEHVTKMRGELEAEEGSSEITETSSASTPPSTNQTPPAEFVPLDPIALAPQKSYYRGP